MSDTRDGDFLPDPINPLDDEATIEREDGERVLDPDVDDDRIDSADADRVASGGEDDDIVATRPADE